MSIALIVGAGAGLSASLARKLHGAGHRIVLVARDTSDLGALGEETGAMLVDADARSPADMGRVFDRIDEMGGDLSVALYNPSARVRGPITEVDPAAVETALMVSAYGAFLMAQQAARRMLKAGAGTMLFTGASAGVKGYPQSASFAMGKFALRGLCQSLARELHPKGIHIGHVVIDGGIAKAGEGNEGAERLDPDAIAESYMHLLGQPKSAWAWEIELRPWVERF